MLRGMNNPGQDHGELPVKIKSKDVSPILYLVKTYVPLSRMGADLQRLIQYCAIKNTDG